MKKKLIEFCEVILIIEILFIEYVYEGYFKLLECIVLSFVDDKFNFL